MSQSDDASDPQSSSSHGHHSHAKEHGHGYEHQDPADWIPGVELDAQISMPAVMSQIQAKIDLGSPGRILDVGCGPGIGTMELARRFPDATLSGLDVGEAVLDAAVTRAAADGVADRVNFIRADFDQDLAQVVEPVDMAFASMSLHHTEDPGAALGRVCATLTSGGRMVMAEFGRPLKMWPDDHEAVTSGLWQRWQAVADAFRLDHLGEAAVNVNWPELLKAQGLDQVEQFECDIHSPAPLSDGLERAWLAKGLERGLQNFGDRLDSEDRSALEALLDADNPDGVSRSTEALVDTSRMVYTGIRR